MILTTLYRQRSVQPFGPENMQSHSSYHQLELHSNCSYKTSQCTFAWHNNQAIYQEGHVVKLAWKGNQSLTMLSVLHSHCRDTAPVRHTAWIACSFLNSSSPQGHGAFSAELEPATLCALSAVFFMSTIGAEQFIYIKHSNQTATRPSQLSH